MSDPKKRMTFDEAMAEIEDVARNGEGAQKLRALAMIQSQESTTVALPDPLSLDEQVERISRLLRAAGPKVSQFAYRNAFASSKKSISDLMPKVELTDVPAFYKATLPKSLKQLYRQFPEIKRGGYPAGYPLKGGIEMQQLWCQRKAVEILRAREEERLKSLEPEAAIAHQTIGDENREA